MPTPKHLPQPNDADEATSAHERDVSDFAPGGQLVFPGAPAQLGLDGRAYEPREASPHLDPSHDVSCRDALDPLQRALIAGGLKPRPTPEQEARWSELYAEARARQARARVARDVQRQNVADQCLDDSTTLNNPEALQYWDRDGDATYARRDLYYVAESVLAPLSSHSTRGTSPDTEKMRVSSHSTRGALTQQLTLPLDVWKPENTPQLSMWARLEVSRALLGNSEFDRDAKCQWVRFNSEGDVSVKRFSSGTFVTGGRISCGHWTCPHCGPKRARDTSSKLGAAIEQWLLPGRPERDVWMLTLTIRHQLTDDPRVVVERAYAASERFFRSRRWRRFARRFGVVGKVRVLDATHGGPEGVHPHFHVAVFVDNARIPSGWTASPAPAFGRRARERGNAKEDAEFAERFITALLRPPSSSTSLESLIGEPLRIVDRETSVAYLDELAQLELAETWETSCAAVGIAVGDRAKFRGTVHLSPAEDAAAYFVKWGLSDEVGAPTAKYQSHLRLLDLVRAGHDAAGDLFIAWRHATQGRAWVTGLADLCARIGVTDELAAAYLEQLREKRTAMLVAAGTPPVEVRELELVVRSHVYAAFQRIGEDRVFAFINGIADETELDPQEQLDQFLWRHLADQRGPPN